MRKFLRLSAVCFSVMAAATGAVQGASAGSPGGSLLLNLPTANAAATPAAAVVSETPFQSFAVMSCSGGAGSSICRAKLPVVPAKVRLVIQFASCIAITTQGGQLGNINISVTDANATKLFGGHFIAPTFRGGAVSTIHVASQPMLITVQASQVLHLEATPNGGSLTLARCGLSGVRQTLG